MLKSLPSLKTPLTPELPPLQSDVSEELNTLPLSIFFFFLTSHPLLILLSQPEFKFIPTAV